MSTAPLQFLLMTFAGWVNWRQRGMIDYLKEETLSSASNSMAGSCGAPTSNAAASL
jgi:hypothetical protein